MRVRLEDNLKQTIARVGDLVKTEDGRYHLLCRSDNEFYFQSLDGNKKFHRYKSVDDLLMHFEALNGQLFHYPADHYSLRVINY